MKSSPRSTRVRAPALDEEQVATYLLSHPQFFERRPDVLSALTLPHAPDGAVSLVQRQVERLREDKARLERRLAELVANARRNEALAEKTHRLMMDLLDSPEPAALAATLEARLRQDFGAERVVLRLTGALGAAAGAAVEDEAAFEAAFGEVLERRRSLCGRLRREQRAHLFGEEAEVASCALMPLVGPGLRGLLAVGSADVVRFQPGMGTLFLDRLAEMVARRLVQMAAA